MSSMLMPWEVAELVRQKTGIKLFQTQNTTNVLVDERPERSYLCALYGPWYPVDEGKTTPNRDTRIWVCWRRLEDMITMELLVQDTDDDCFLNRDAAGVERYNVNPIYV